MWIRTEHPGVKLSIFNLKCFIFYKYICRNTIWQIFNEIIDYQDFYRKNDDLCLQKIFFLNFKDFILGVLIIKKNEKLENIHPRFVFCKYICKMYKMYIIEWKVFYKCELQTRQTDRLTFLRTKWFTEELRS